MSWQTVLDDSFTHADTATGAAGTTTGVPTTPAIGAANAWTDEAGGTWQILGNQLVSAAPGGSYATQSLLRPAGEIAGTDQRLLATTEPSVAGGEKWAAVLRVVNPLGEFYLFEFNDVNHDTNIYTVIGGVASLLQAGPTFPGVTVGHQYTIDVSAVGTNPTTVTFIITDITPGGSAGYPVTVTATDSSASLQAADTRYGLDSYNAPAKFARVRAFQVGTFLPAWARRPVPVIGSGVY